MPIALYVPITGMSMMMLYLTIIGVNSVVQIDEVCKTINAELFFTLQFLAERKLFRKHIRAMRRITLKVGVLGNQFFND